MLKHSAFAHMYVCVFQAILKINISNLLALGRAIAQAVSRWLPTAAARVRARVWWDL
jgi:hypothetical protein